MEQNTQPAEKARLRRLNLRLTESEWDKIHRLAANSTCRSTSEYARKVLSQKPVRVFYRNQSFDDFEEQMVRLLPRLETCRNDFDQLSATINEIKELLIKLSDNETKNNQLQQHSQITDLQRTETHTR
jgi:hypothetical protein